MLFQSVILGSYPMSITWGWTSPPPPSDSPRSQWTQPWHWHTSCQPGKHAKQPLEKQNSPLSRACGMSMIYLGRNLPSVLISLKEIVTKIATGRLKINQLSCAVAFPLFPLMLNPNSHPSIHVSMSLAPLPSRQSRDGYLCRVIANSTE